MPEAAQPMPGRILTYDAQGAWVDAVPSIHLGICGYDKADSVGPDMAFARSLITRGVSQRVGLVPTACGGTNLYEQWKPGGQLYSDMVKRGRDAMAAASGAVCGGAVLRGILWVQGESDADSLEHAKAYGATFEAWVAAARRDLASLAHKLPVLLVVMSVRGRDTAFPYLAEVRRQQQNLKLDLLATVDMDGLEFFPEFPNPAAPGGSLVHLTKAGTCALGTALACEYGTARRAWQDLAAGDQVLN